MNFATAADVEARMPGGIPFDVWIDTIDHIKETKKVAALGRRAYEAFYGDDVSSHQENLELLRVLADLLHKAFENRVSAERLTCSSNEKFRRKCYRRPRCSSSC